MTPEQLMQPRYEVIGDYPHSPYKVGDIIQTTDTNRRSVCVTQTPDNSEWSERGTRIENFYNIADLSLWPVLFLKVQWWQKREIEEMPEYLIYDRGQHRMIGKAIEYDLSGVAYAWVEKDRYIVSLSECLPATEAEYLEYRERIDGEG